MSGGWSDLQVEQAQYEANLAQRRYDAVDSDYRIVARELERRWKHRLVELEHVRDRARAAAREHRALTQDQEELHEGRRLAKDLERLWNAPTTADVDRKTLLRTVLDEVQVRVEDETVELRAVWKGGACTDLTLERHPYRPVHATPEDTVDLIRKLAIDLDDAQIARVLNKQGRRGVMGRPYTKEGVRALRRNKRHRTVPETASSRSTRGTVHRR